MKFAELSESGIFFRVHGPDFGKKVRVPYRLRLLFLPLSFILLTGHSCTVGPDYEKPLIKMPDGWTYAVSKDLQSPQSGSQLWWRKFQDPTLNRLITRARAGNPNIKIAYSRIRQAWYQRGVLAAAFYPHLDATGRDEYGMGSFDRSGINFDPFESHGQLAQIDAGWELDIFGKIKRQTEAAEAEWQARTEGLRDAQVFITAEVALNYIALRTLEQRLGIARQSSKTFGEIYQMIKGRAEEGLAAEVDVAESEARLRSSEAEIPQLEKEIAVIKNQLAALTVSSPRDLRTAIGTGPIPKPPGSITTGYPAELLRSRPDVRRAERKIANQTALVGVATADLYPQLSLSGAITYEYLSRGNVTELLRRVLGLGATLRQRIYHGCADHYRIKEQKAILEEVITEYEKTIITAVTETEDALAGLHFEKKRLLKLEAASKAHQKTAGLMLEAYKIDLVDLRRLLNANQDAFATRDEEAATRGRNAAHAVRLFKALGGGELPAPEFPKGHKSSWQLFP
ncbi:TolC family protein [Verrucomicrobiaceae bacterium 227]